MSNSAELYKGLVNQRITKDHFVPHKHSKSEMLRSGRNLKRIPSRRAELAEKDSRRIQKGEHEEIVPDRTYTLYDGEDVVRASLVGSEGVESDSSVMSGYIPAGFEVDHVDQDSLFEGASAYMESVGVEGLDLSSLKQ